MEPPVIQSAGVYCQRRSDSNLASVSTRRFEFQQLDRCAVVEDERDPRAWGRRVRRNQDFLTVERGVQIVDRERQMRNCLHNVWDRTLRIEAHPLDAVRARLEPADVNAELRQVPLSGTGNTVRDAEVVKSPSELRDGRGSFVPAPDVIHERILGWRMLAQPSSTPRARCGFRVDVPSTTAAQFAAEGHPIRAPAIEQNVLAVAITVLGLSPVHPSEGARAISPAAFQQLLHSYRTGRADEAIRELAAWPVDELAAAAEASTLQLSSSDRMAAAILEAEVIRALLAVHRTKDSFVVVRSAQTVLHDVARAPFGEQLDDEPKRSWYYAVTSALVGSYQTTEASALVETGLKEFHDDALLLTSRG